MVKDGRCRTHHSASPYAQLKRSTSITERDGVQIDCEFYNGMIVHGSGGENYEPVAAGNRAWFLMLAGNAVPVATHLSGRAAPARLARSLRRNAPTRRNIRCEREPAGDQRSGQNTRGTDATNFALDTLWSGRFVERPAASDLVILAQDWNHRDLLVTQLLDEAGA